MAKQLHPDVLDKGISEIKTSATKIMLINGYSIGDSLAAITANRLAEAAVATGDFTLGNVAGDNGTDRRIVFAAGKTGNATVTVAAGQPLHFAFVDGTRVLWVTKETSEMAVTAGNPIEFPSLTHVQKQPAA